MPRFPTRTDGATHPAHDDGPRLVRNRVRGYRVAAVVLTVLVAGAIFDGINDEIDLVGVGQGEVSAREGGHELTVRYPSVTRPALGSPFDIVVHSADGFGAEVELAVNQAFLEVWDLNGIIPTPKEERADGDEVIWVFDAPDGDVMRVVYDGRIQPARQSGVDGRVRLVDDGATVLAVDWHTRIMP